MSKMFLVNFKISQFLIPYSFTIFSEKIYKKRERESEREREREREREDRRR